MTKRKFYFFDVGLYKTLRPRGPLDSEAEINGPAFETLCLQELMALNHYLSKGYEFFHWRTKKHQEVDLVLYGENGFLAFEFKSSSRLREADFEALKLFGEDYPPAERYLIYGGNEKRSYAGIHILPAQYFFSNAESLLT
jgi:predicted AAA+ superfamily ATPase